MDDVPFNDHMMLSLSTNLMATSVALVPPRNLAELTQQVASWTDFSAAKRSVSVSHIRTIGLAAVTAIAHRRNELGVPPRKQVDLRSVPCDPEWLNAHIYELEPKVFGMKREVSFSAAVSSMRVALRRVGLLDGDLPTVPVDSNPWRFLLDALTNRGSLYGHGLGDFASWCHQQCIIPFDVDDGTLTAYETYLRTRTLRRDIPRHIRNVAKSWRVASTMIAEWPDREIKAPSRRERYVLPLTAYPDSFQKDVHAYLVKRDGSARGGPFTRGGPRKPWRQETLKSRLFSIRQAAVALVLEGRPIETITCLSHLVEEAAFEIILRHYWTRGLQKAVDDGLYESLDLVPEDLGKTGTTRSVAITLIGVVKHHVPVPEKVFDRLAQMADDVIPERPTQISDKNLARVRQFDDPKIKRDLLELSRRQMKDAEGDDLKPRHAAVKARTAVAIEILLNSPVRLKNLVALQFGTHLRYDGSRKGTLTHLRLAAHETKNSRAYEVVIDPDLAKMIATYRSKFHPILAPKGSTYLFPGGNGEGALSGCAMYAHITSMSAEEAGAHVNPNLFRHLHARFTLECDPNALEDVRQGLGDKSQGIVLAHYTSMEPAAAARRHHERLKLARSGRMLTSKRKVKR